MDKEYSTYREIFFRLVLRERRGFGARPTPDLHKGNGELAREVVLSVLIAGAKVQPLPAVACTIGARLNRVVQDYVEVRH